MTNEKILDNATVPGTGIKSNIEEEGKIIPVQIDNSGNVLPGTDEGRDEWVKMYEKMIAEGKTKEEAKKAADLIKEKIDNVYNDGYLLKEVAQW
jgi:hypothetical protein